MSVAHVTEQDTWESLLRIWRDLDVPEGWRPELTAEGIVVTPPPGGTHNLVADRVHRALLTATPDECGIFQTQSIGTAAAMGIYIPDLCVAPRSIIPPDSDPAPADEVLLAVEITSRSNAHHDRRKKRWAYAHGGVPLYLLIDRFDEEGPTVSLFSEPSRGSYHRITRVPFGEPIEIGPPFDLTLETADF